MGKFFNIKFNTKFKFLENKNLGNCALTGEFGQLDEHHVITRSRGGKKTVWLSRKAHQWVGEHIQEAKKLNLYKDGYILCKTKKNKKKN